MTRHIKAVRGGMRATPTDLQGRNTNGNQYKTSKGGSKKHPAHAWRIRGGIILPAGWYAV